MTHLDFFLQNKHSLSHHVIIGLFLVVGIDDHYLRTWVKRQVKDSRSSGMV